MEQIKKPELSKILAEDSKVMEQIRAIASNYYKKFGSNTSRGIYSKQDLECEGILAATEVYQKFDPSRGAAFMTFAYPYIINAMLSCCRKNSHALSISTRDSKQNLHLLNDISTITIDSQESPVDIPVGSGYDYSNEIVEHYFRGFSNLERDILQDHLLYDMSLSELSTKYNIKKCTIRNIVSDGKNKIKEVADNEQDC